MQICLRINQCVSYSLIALSAVWFIFVIIVNNRTEDPRINSLNLMSPISDSFSDRIYLSKIQQYQKYLDLSHNTQSTIHQAKIFELIEIMNDQSPNMIGDQVILIVSITNQKLDLSSIKFAQELYNKNGGILTNSTFQNSNKQQTINTQSDQNEESKQIPIYILRQTEPVILTNQKYLLSYKRQIQSALNYFVKILGIKKLSLLSFEIGALLTLYSLALQKDIDVFNSLDKVVLINPFNLEIKIFHSPPVTFVEDYIKPAILQNDQRFNQFNNLRLILISTTRTVFHESPIAQQYFSFSFKKAQQESQIPLPTPNPQSFLQPIKHVQELYRFNNTITISTRAMSNVFCFFDKQIYFFYEPFITLLSKFFRQDSKKSFSIEEIQYYFHYKQLPEVKQLSQRTKRKYISKCIDFSLQNYDYMGNTFGGSGRQQEQCIRLLRKQSIYFSQSSILLYSKQRFQVYGENFQKLYPFQSKTTYMVYHIERINQFRRLFIINRKSALIHLKIAPIFMPLTNPIVSLEAGENSNNKIDQLELSQINFQNLTNFQIVRTCEPANLIFPIHFAKMARFGQHSLHFDKQSNSKNCYTQYDNYDFYPDWFALNWNVLRNIMVFTLFVSQLLEKTLASRFYTQSVVNQFLVYFSTGSVFLFQNFIIMSSLCLFETILNFFMQGMEYLVAFRKISVKFLWVPIVLQLVSDYFPNLPSSWKVLFLLLGPSISKNNIYLILIKLSFMIDSIRFDSPNMKGIFAISVWSYIAAFNQQNLDRNNQIKKKILDVCFLFSIGVCINQQGSVIDEIINAYILMQTILYINNRFF